MKPPCSSLTSSEVFSPQRTQRNTEVRQGNTQLPSCFLCAPLCPRLHARPSMKALLRPFTPTKNRRFNELIGFCLIAAALLLVLALASYSPSDPSLNTAAAISASSSTHNWIGPVGAIISDLALQLFGIAVFSI